MKKLFKSKPLLVVASLFIISISIAVLIIYYFIELGVLAHMPDEKELKQIQNYTASEVYSSDGVLLGKYFLQDRTNVAFQDISPNVINALIATEDARFYQHTGVDNISMLRVLFKSLLMGESAGGGSTLSQQLAKNLYLRQQFPFLSMPFNKLREALIAKKLERIFSKEDVLSLYLNTVTFGENAYGIESASKRYFSKSAKNISLTEAAMLVGLLKATTSYNPRKDLEKAKTRRNVVLAQMNKYGYLEYSKMKDAQASPIKLKYKSISHSEGPAPYFREELRQDLVQWCQEHNKPDGSNYNLYTDGLKIYTSIDSRMQKYAEQSVKEHMRTLQKEFFTHWRNKTPWNGNAGIVWSAIKRTDSYRMLKKQGLEDNEIRKKLSVKKKMVVYSYNGEKIINMSPIDSIKYYLWYLHAGFIVTQPQTGFIKAWVGGINHKFFQYDHITINTKRQVGSTFKPIVYAAALNAGVNPCEMIPNERKTYAEYNNWSPGNADGNYEGYYSMQGALTHSVNTISAQLILKAGVNQTIELAENLGIISHLDANPSLALGTADISLIEMAGAYGALANRGIYNKARFLISINDRQNKVLEKFELTESKRSLSSTTADMVRGMMQNVAKKGTASALASQYGLYNEIAGKTGTTQGQADGWFIGFTPKLLGAVWVGGEDRRIRFRSLQLGQGAHMALPIWARFFRKLNSDPKLKYYNQGHFPALSEEALPKLNCPDYLITTDTLSFLEKIFKPNSSRKNDKNKPSGKHSEKYQNTWTKIRNMFRRK